MRLTYFGHSAFQLEVGDAVVQIDPFITDNPLASAVTSADRLEADAILLTHAHGDHFGDTPSIASRTGALVVSNFEITQYMASRHGHDNTQPLNTGGKIDLPWGRVTYTWVRHSSSFPDGTYGGNPGGFVIEAEGKCLYISGDTAPFFEMTWIGETHDIDVAVLPIGDVFTMGIEGSIRAAGMLGASKVVPCHFDTFPPIKTDTEAWSERMRAAGQMPHVMAPGQSLTL